MLSGFCVPLEIIEMLVRLTIRVFQLLPYLSMSKAIAQTIITSKSTLTLVNDSLIAQTYLGYVKSRRIGTHKVMQEDPILAKNDPAPQLTQSKSYPPLPRHQLASARFLLQKDCVTLTSIQEFK